MKNFYFLTFFFFAFLTKAQLSVTANQTALALANNLLGGGVTISNPTLTCAGVANGLFSNGASTGLGFNQGVILSSGRAIDAAGAPANFASTSTGGAPIPAMGTSTYDGCYLGFQITPKCNNLNIRYRFGSEEYTSYVGSSFNDAFGFFISGPNPAGGNYTNLNMATVPGFTNTGVAVNSINNGNNNSGPCMNCAYYNNSVPLITMDGITTILTASANVTPCSTYTLFMAIVDRNDDAYDSEVFLEKSGISCTTPTVNITGATICAGQSTTLTASGVTTYSWSTGATTSSIVVNPGSTTSYTVNGSDIGPCIQDSKVVTVNVNTAPTANAGSTTTLNCTATSVLLSGSGGGTYAWSGPGIVSNGNTATPTINQPGTYTLIVTAAGCPSLPSTVVISQNITPPIPSASTTSTLTCATTTAALTGGGGGSYSWSGTGIVSGGSTASPVVNGTGPYVLIVTAANGCTATATTNVPQNTTLPTPSISNTPTLTCLTTTASLFGGGGGTYTWSGPGIIAGGSTSTPTINLQGLYSLTVTAANGCKAIITKNVNQNIVAPTITMPATQTISCGVASVTLAASSIPSNGVPVWTGGVISGANSFTATASAVSFYTLTVTDPANGCSNTGVVQVVGSNNVPFVLGSFSNTITCSTTTAQAIATTTNTPVSYTWTGPGIVSGSSTPTVNVSAGGVYTVVVQNLSSMCSSTVFVNVPTNMATITPTISLNQSLSCIITSLTINGNPASGVTYTWTGAGITSNPNLQNVNVNQTGSYTLSVTNTLTGCTSSTTTVVTGDSSTPNLTSSNAVLPCGSPSIIAAATSTSNGTYSWAGPSSTSIISGGNTANPTIGEAGTYTVTFTNTQGCVNSVTIAVTQSSINAAFTADPTTGVAPLTVNLTNQSTGNGITYTWNFGNGLPNVTTTNPTTTYTTNGTFTITLITTSGLCTSTATTVIIVEDGLTLEIPNVFTPNNDGKNDFFSIRSTGVKEISLQIFNRWGEKLYEYTGAKAAWDGLTPGGAKVPDGTYFFFVKATGYDDKTIEKQGTVNLFR